MDIWTAVMLALVLCGVLFVPFFIMNAGRGKAKGHTWFTRSKPQGHSDIGPDMGGMRQTRPNADDARGARY